MPTHTIQLTHPVTSTSARTTISFSAFVVATMVPAEFHAHVVARAVGVTATVRILAATPAAES